jgi:hypothetical protein
MELLPNLGFKLCQFTDQELAPLRREVATIQANWQGTVFNQHLVGNLKHEYQITQSTELLDQILRPQVLSLEQESHYAQEVYVQRESGQLVLDDVWVNYQRAGEFNPVHDHRGIYSWVIWLELPYTLAAEDQHVPWVTPDKNFAGQFVIHYTDIVGNIKNYPLPTDQRMRNHCAVFPSRLRHSVYPFYTTDQLRISISGNFMAAQST